MQADQPQEVTIEEAARLLGCSPATVRRRIKRGSLHAVKATTQTGFVYRVRLDSVAYPGEGPTQTESAQIQRYADLGSLLEGMDQKLTTLTEDRDRLLTRLEELAVENERLRNRLAEPWWVRWFVP